MAAPTATLTAGAGTITAAGEDNGFLLTIDPYFASPRLELGASGTFTGATLAVRGRLRGLTQFYPLTGVSRANAQQVSDSTGLSLANSGSAAFTFDVGQCDAVEVYLTALSTGDVDVEARVAAAAPDETPLVVNTVAGQQTFGGNVTLSTGADLVFSGTTGQSEVSVTDNLADALSVKVASGNDLLVLDSTDGAEKVTIGGSATGQQVFIRPGTLKAVQKDTATTVTTAGAGTYTAAALLGGLILRDPTGASRTDTTHTAAQLVAALPGVAVGDTVDVMVVNTADAAETITLAGGAGVTLVPATVTIAQNEVFIGKLRFTNVTGSSEAVTIYGGNVAG